jgi:hypothetical protein
MSSTPRLTDANPQWLSRRTYTRLAATQLEVLSHNDCLNLKFLFQRFLSTIFKVDKKMLFVKVESSMYTSTFYNLYEHSLLGFH